MASFAAALRVQINVIGALMVRELNTRFGRENIGFLWLAAEPLLFAVLVAAAWNVIKGSSEHGVGIVAFVVSGYLPLTFLRHSFGRCTNVFIANSSLLYHKQIKILDFVFVRVLLEMLGSMIAYLFIAVLLMYFDLFPVPYDMGYLIAGWFLYALFVLSLCLIIAPLSEMSGVLEKVLPVTVYIAIPVSGTFTMASWMTPQARDFVNMSPLVNAMEMMRYGIFGDLVRPYYNPTNPIVVSMVLIPIGLALCRRIRRNLVIE
jgi:capsular polysaccharide transport system permease protein